MSARAPLQALTLRQPWASACFFDLRPKRVEHRSWAPQAKLRDWSAGRSAPLDTLYLAVHAGRVTEPAALQWLQRQGVRLGPLPRGALLGVVRLAAVVDKRELSGAALGELEREHGHWWESAERSTYAWLLEAAVRFPEPLPCPGQQGLWPVPAELLPHVRELWLRGVAGEGAP